ncbi:hypothetical protein [Hymenobacter sp. UYP22]|uniref:hypothetical protein n=1 Tax=Hymenobacter sp. UYP22 TaxID=3156348 RepID=UPI0033967237
MMSTYLYPAELKARVHLGKEIEQWLSYVQETEYSYIRWLSISKDGNQFTVTYFESVDEGDEDFYDVYEFSALDSDEFPDGALNEFNSVEDAVAFAVETYGASADKFLASGMIQDEYSKHRRQNSL